MEEMFDQIRGAISCKLYYSALFMTLAIPDICAALESEDNRTTGEKYRNWFDRYIPNLAPNKYGEQGQLTAGDLWNIRCSLFHQGITSNKGEYKRLLFLEPGTSGYESLSSLHCVVVGSHTSDKSLQINIVKFCKDIIAGAEQWLKEMDNTPTFSSNCINLIRRYPEGIFPIFGTPVIG